MNFSSIDEFEKEFKRLSKKYKSLAEDLEEFKKVINLIPLGTSKHFAVLHVHNSIKIIKARFFCKYLKGSSLRIIYSFNDQIQKIEFIEIYFKGNKENEDRRRIESYVKNII